jgi:hypothetical protein
VRSSKIENSEKEEDDFTLSILHSYLSLLYPDIMVATSSDIPAITADPTFTTLKGPVVPRSHSFLPLRCGPPIYFPLPAPYDQFCLTGILPSDKPILKDEVEPSGDVKMGQEGGSDKDGESSNASQIEGQRRIEKLGDVEGWGGWEYPSESSCWIGTPLGVAEYEPKLI